MFVTSCPHSCWYQDQLMTPLLNPAVLIPEDLRSHRHNGALVHAVDVLGGPCGRLLNPDRQPTVEPGELVWSVSEARLLLAPKDGELEGGESWRHRQMLVKGPVGEPGRYSLPRIQGQLREAPPWDTKAETSERREGRAS